MRQVALPVIGTVSAWRDQARALLAEGVPPEAVAWSHGEAAGDLFAAAPPEDVARSPRKLNLPRAALPVLNNALCHADPERFARAYAILWRMAGRDLRWGDRSDRAMKTLLDQARAVARDIHKMHAFVRFREGAPHGDRRAFAAWFEPDHPIVEAAAPFFARRFGDMDWIIATPGISALFEDGALSFRETGTALPAPEDATEDLWRTYYASIFNPARLKVGAMQSEMPKKYWKNLPEAELIPDLIRTAQARSVAMVAAAPTQPPAHAAALARMRALDVAPLPDLPPFAQLRAEAMGCTRCPLHGPATQTVWGEGPEDAALMIVGEQPGESEDLEGRPFVGPAGQLLRRAAGEAGVDLGHAYLTNAVKHFKFQPRGKRRIHRRPNAGEVSHCRWWLEREVAHVGPRLTLAMGATAALALTGDGGAINRRRGRVERGLQGQAVLLTVHPAFLLRLPDADARAQRYAGFVADLGLAGEIAET